VVQTFGGNTSRDIDKQTKHVAIIDVFGCVVQGNMTYCGLFFNIISPTVQLS
jgi:hypothetical protein